MKKTIINYLLLQLGMLILNFNFTIAVTPVNPNSIPEAKNLLHFIDQIQGKYILSGHHNYSFALNEFTDSVKNMTGTYPVIWGSDFSFSFKGKDPQEERNKLIDEVIKAHEKGHIITLMWHCCFPADGDSCSGKTIWVWQPGISQEKWQELVTDGTELNEQWKQQVDHVALHLKELQDRKIPVLWRPYHEMNGIWFWWCNKRGENGFVKLWKMMYDRFTNYHHLNNLIWVWNANAPRDKKDDEAYAYDLFFPGLEYVDILAADVYHNDYKQAHHDDLLKLAQGKPIALGEVGRMPTPGILENQPQWTWFMGWANWLFKANKKKDVIELYNAPNVITLDEIEIGQKGVYRVKID